MVGMIFIIISPQTISLLISKIRNSPDKELAVKVEDIMPADFARYLVNVINSNRQVIIIMLESHGMTLYIVVLLPMA